MRRLEIARRFDEIVSFAEVEPFIDTPVKRYSSGMYMRLAFAVAAHLETEILLVDEVLAVGDAVFQRRCLGKMGEVARAGRTVLFVSHNLMAVRSLCSRAYLLSRGRIIDEGPAGDVVDSYLLGDEQLAAFISTNGLPRNSDSPGTTLRITEIRLAGGAGVAIVDAGFPLAVEMTFVVTAPVSEALVAWGVHSSDGTRLFETRSVPRDYEPGTYVVRGELPENPLNPGLYALHVGGRSAQASLDYLPDVLAFRVELPDQLDSLWLEAPSGAMRVEVDWSEPQQVSGRDSHSPQPASSR